ncbi:protein SSUH2 homolog isoform X2 [Pyxicephalus adspersus]|uniref:protein SSUH2 homolog isoform X2 n=1 Tax=Pyxicephalus adspersus TaxID=30357 RepID=UPI003B5CB785
MSGMDPPSYEEVIAGAGGNHFAAGPSSGVALLAQQEDSLMDILPGYEEITSDGMFEPPPPYTPPCVPSAPPMEIRMPAPYISEDVVRQALKDYSKKHSFFSSKVVNEMVLEKFLTFHTHRYRLETFTESRHCKWVTVPYDGRSIDGLRNQQIPKPWDIPVQVPKMFRDGEQNIKVPHSSRVLRCGDCKGKGKHICLKCGGSVWSVYGTQRSTCLHCMDSDSYKCRKCSGQGFVMKYVLLSIKWTNNTSEFVADHKSNFPSKSFKKVTGEVVFSDEQMSLQPITGFPDPSINEASQKEISLHRSQSRRCKILRQKHSIEWIPLTKVEYSWKND